VENLPPPIADRRSCLLPKCVDGNRIDEGRRTRTSERDAHIADHAPHEHRVTVVRPDERLAPVIELPERRPALLTVTQYGQREIRAFEMLRPLGAQPVYALMRRLKVGDLRIGQLAPYRDDEVDVAVLVEIAHRKGALEVGADERVT